MKRLVDVVNFNADASCLAASEWLAILQGGRHSRFCQWLGLYVELKRKVTLGLVGGAVADLAALNPEAIELINAAPEIFELIPRPFSHDIGLLRSDRGFALNVSLGRAVAQREFRNLTDFFLPPEFMLTSGQVKLLADAGTLGVFLNSNRFKREIQDRIPAVPYLLEGVLGSELACIPFQGDLTEAYLNSLHLYSGAGWGEAVLSQAPARVFSWRDGESSFLLPEGLARERAWLADEPSSIERQSLREALGETRFAGAAELAKGTSRAYPVHSFSAWFKEFRMLGFLGRLERVEARLEELSPELRVVWLQAINSDVLSAVEKDSPNISLRHQDGSETRFTIWRTERGFEGEDYLAILESERGQAHLRDSPKSHLVKLRARIAYVQKLARAEAQ